MPQSPKRMSERLSHMTKEQRTKFNVLKVAWEATSLEGPELGGLHPLAQGWYESLSSSPVSSLYQEPDWAFAAVVAEAMHLMLTEQVDTERMLRFVMWGSRELLSTELSRRQAHVEIVRGDPTEEQPSLEADPADGMQISERELEARLRDRWKGAA